MLPHPWGVDMRELRNQLYYDVVGVNPANALYELFRTGVIGLPAILPIMTASNVCAVEWT